ncbi:MAG: hypothetical protein WBW76_14805 [Candidatus Cybelea sp.]
MSLQRERDGIASRRFGFGEVSKAEQVSGNWKRFVDDLKRTLRVVRNKLELG